MHYVSAWDLAIASILVCISIIISTLLRLGLTKQIIIAALRTVIQLSAIGMILKYIFATDDPQWIVVIVLIMTLVAGFSAGGRGAYTYKGLRYDALLAVWITSWIVAIIGLYAVLRIHPWHSPQFVIPILGMILGNTLNAVALTFNRITQAVAEQRGKIEMYLSLGASPWEAFRSLARQAISAGMLPTINSMTIVGIVSLPGMMTGQILAGGDPEQAVRYQIIVMFFLCAAAALGSILAVWLTFKRLFSAKSCFLFQRLILRAEND